VASIFGCCLIGTLRVPDQASDKSTTPPRRSIIARRRWVSHRAPEIPQPIYVCTGRAKVQQYLGLRIWTARLEPLPGLVRPASRGPPNPRNVPDKSNHPIRSFDDGYNAKRPPTEAASLVPNTLAAIAFERSNDCLSVREVHSSD